MRRSSQSLPSASSASLTFGTQPHIEFNPRAKVALWALTVAYGYIYGLNSKGNKTVTAIDTMSNDCVEPSTVKVDHAENLWVSCGASTSGPGSIQEYAPGSKKPSVTFADTFSCGSSCVLTVTRLTWRSTQTDMRSRSMSRSSAIPAAHRTILRSGGAQSHPVRHPWEYRIPTSLTPTTRMSILPGISMSKVMDASEPLAARCSTRSLILRPNRPRSRISSLLARV